MIRRMPFQRPLILSIVISIFKDRAFWAMLSRIWDGWRESLVMVKPATVSGWRRKRGLGRPRISVEVRKLIVEMAELAKNLLLEQTAIEVIEQERVQNELVFELIETATGFGRSRQRPTIGEVRTLS